MFERDVTIILEISLYKSRISLIWSEFDRSPKKLREQILFVFTTTGVNAQPRGVWGKQKVLDLIRHLATVIPAKVC